MLFLSLWKKKEKKRKKKDENARWEHAAGKGMKMEGRRTGSAAGNMLVSF